MNRSGRSRLLGGVLGLALCAMPGMAPAQVFLASRPHPDFAVGPLLVVAGVRPDLGPVSLRISFGLTLPPNKQTEDIAQDLYILWPAEVVSGSAPGAPDPELHRYVEERGFVVV